MAIATPMAMAMATATTLTTRLTAARDLSAAGQVGKRQVETKNNLRKPYNVLAKIDLARWATAGGQCGAISSALTARLQPHSNHNWNWTLCFSISLSIPLYLSLLFSYLRRLICFAVPFWMVSIRSLFGCCCCRIAICHWPFTIYHFPLTIWHLCLLLAASAHPKLISNTAAVTFDTLPNGFARSADRFPLHEEL